MTAAEWLIAGWFGIAVAVTALFSLLCRATRTADEWDRLAKKPYLSPGWERRDVNIIDAPPFDWSRYEQEVTS